MNLSAVVALRAGQAPERPALWFGDQVWTWAEFDAQVRRCATALHALGARRGDRVGLFLRNGPDLVFVLLGALWQGIVPVAVSSLYQPGELAKSLEQTSPCFVVTDRAIEDLAAALPSELAGLLRPGPGSPAWEEAAQGPVPPEIVEPGEDEEGLILFTGGTTGMPKPVAMTQHGVMRALRQLARAGGRERDEWPYALAPETVPPNIVALPLFHSGGQHAFFFALYTGRAVVLMERFSAAGLVEAVHRHRVDNLFLLPTMLYDLAHLPGEVTLPSVRTVLVAGQPLSQSLKAAFETRFGVPILMNYGSTEIGHVAGWTGRDVREGRWKPGSVGRVYDNVDIEIRDDDGRPLPPGQAGEIFVRSALVRGYVGADSGDLIRDGWVRSGDVGYLDEDRVLFLVGRRREMIKTGGFQVWPLEIEEVLRAHPDVADVAVVGMADERLGEVPKAYVVPVDPDADPDALAATLLAHARQRLAHFKAPRRIEVVAELPRTAAGKVDKASLAGSSAQHEGAR